MKSLMTKKRIQKSSSSIVHLKPRTQTKKEQELDIHSIAQKLKENLSHALRPIHKVQPKKKPYQCSLSNLRLLKQYLTFVSQETDGIHLMQDKIQFDLLNQQQPIEPVSETQKSARLGATLIESMVHTNDKQTDQDKSVLRRPGRPPKQQPVLEKKLKKSVIQCICDSPTEEYGSMVQCDDCNRWLHLDCLELNQEQLKEERTFRCPYCFLSLDHSSDDKKFLSSITWRYAAQWKSKCLVNKIQEDEDEDIEDIAVSDWSDNSSELSSTESSEINTPIEKQDPFLNNPYQQQQQLILDSESLEILSRLAYLQSLDSVRKEIFAPNASDVFLYENKPTSDLPIINPTRFAANVPPSDICSQDLDEYSFDSGPFWEPLF